MARRRWLGLVLTTIVAGALVPSAHAASHSPGESATELRQRLGDAEQALLLGEPAQARRLTDAARAEFSADVAARLPRPARRSLEQALADAQAGARRGDLLALTTARSRVETGLVAVGFKLALAATLRGDAAAAREWLLVRDFRPPTRLSRPGADATVANSELALGRSSRADAAHALRADLLDTYQARMRGALEAVGPALSGGLPVTAAQAAATAAGLWPILATSFREQAGAGRAAAIERDLALLQRATRDDARRATALARSLEARLDGFRAAPLSASEQRRRASQVMTFTPLVGVEYGRGVSDGRVTRDFEIQEAITFLDGASGSFRDLEPQLLRRDAKGTQAVLALFDSLRVDLADAAAGTRVADPDAIRGRTGQLVDASKALFPDAWRKRDVSADFDLIASSLDRMQKAIEAGQYAIAEQARLEAYAFFELGPEQRLRGIAPELFTRAEGLFWYGSGSHDGLADLINSRGAPADITATRDALDGAMREAEEAVGSGPKDRATIIANTAIIVFREGLEAVLILAALMASFKGVERRMRRPMWLGVMAALVASAVTWVVAQTVLTSLAGYGEKLSAVVSLVAIGMLLLILNWFFHKTYWTGHLASLHGKKRLAVGTGRMALAQVAALALLGFTSVYREGFETVLFMQALVLATDVWTVTLGVLAGLAGTVLVGIAVFNLERRLPYKKMLVLTGMMVTWVLVVMVGTTVSILQKVGWLEVTPISGLRLPDWSGLWLGTFPTWEGMLLQLSALVLVIGSYVLLEVLRARRRNRVRRTDEKALSPERELVS